MEQGAVELAEAVGDRGDAGSELTVVLGQHVEAVPQCGPELGEPAVNARAEGSLADTEGGQQLVPGAFDPGHDVAVPEGVVVQGVGLQPDRRHPARVPASACPGPQLSTAPGPLSLRD